MDGRSSKSDDEFSISEFFAQKIRFSVKLK